MRKSIQVLLLLFISLNSLAQERVYLLGVVPQFQPEKLHNIWFPIVKKLEEKTGLKFKMVDSSTIPVFEKSFIKGEFDFAYMNPYHMIVAKKKQGYLPLIRDHGRKLFGILVVRKDSPIQNLKELKGKKISFPAPNALGASLLMRTDLKSVHKLDFNPVYTQTHSSSYLHVIMGITQAGGGVRGTFNRQPEEIRNNLRVIYETRKLQPHPLAVHPRVSKHVAQKVKKALLEIGQTKEGKELMKKIPIKKIGEASMKDYRILLQLGLEKFYIKAL
jgi:phosphonate transport system substrate-binding protein